LDLLDRWNHPDDASLLLKYLTHPFQDRSHRPRGDGQYDVVAVYRVRQRVKSLLEKRGVKVPPDIVYEEVIGPGG
jgi:hypothetical protein